MTEEQAFLAAIAEKPDDHDRLAIYADFLEEQGDPSCEALRFLCGDVWHRGQFVRDGKAIIQHANDIRRMRLVPYAGYIGSGQAIFCDSDRNHAIILI